MENGKKLSGISRRIVPDHRKSSDRNHQSAVRYQPSQRHGAFSFSDIHGEYEAFSHVLRNGSGAVRKKIDDVFGHTLGISEKTCACNPYLLPERAPGDGEKAAGGHR